jgi:hypothetical protein
MAYLTGLHRMGAVVFLPKKLRREDGGLESVLASQATLRFVAEPEAMDGRRSPPKASEGRGAGCGAQLRIACGDMSARAGDPGKGPCPVGSMWPDEYGRCCGADIRPRKERSLTTIAVAYGGTCRPSTGPKKGRSPSRAVILLESRSFFNRSHRLH